MATINGVNVDQLLSTIEVIQNAPGLAEFRFRAETEWIEGGASAAWPGKPRCERSRAGTEE